MTNLADSIADNNVVDDNDDNLSMGSDCSEDDENDDRSLGNKPQPIYKNTTTVVKTTRSGNRNDDDDYTSHTETTDPISNCAEDGSEGLASPNSSSLDTHPRHRNPHHHHHLHNDLEERGYSQSRAAKLKADLLEENKKSAQVDREKRAFKAYKNTVLFMMKNLKRPEGKDDTEWYEAVERQAKAVIEAVDSKKEGEDGIDEGGDEWFKAVEKKVKGIMEEKKVAEMKKLEIQLEEEKKIEVLQIEKAKERKLEALRKEKEKAVEKKKIEDKKKADKENRKKDKENKKKEKEEKKVQPIAKKEPVKFVPLRRTTRNPDCILHTLPKFQYADTSPVNESDENRMAMMEYKTVGWIVTMAKWKKRRAAFQMEQFTKSGCPDCKKDIIALTERMKK